jgi:hypothetical protein
MRPFLASLILTAAGCSFFAVSSHATGFSYDNFASPSLLLFQHDAVVFQDRLRLTPAERSKMGGVWFAAKQNVQNGFQTTFQFQFTDKGGFGADGLAFVIEGGETPRLSRRGSAIGFAHLTNALAVKFDPYHLKKSDVSYKPYDEVAVVMGHSPADRLSPYDSIASVTNEIMFVDQKIHTAEIVYTPGKLQVFLDDLENPLIVAEVDLAMAMNLDHGRAWVGFTAATGTDYYNQDVLSWIFDSVSDTAETGDGASSTSSPQTETNTPSASVPPVYVSNVAPPPMTPLSTDPSFGYNLPAGIGLTHQIETSTDLVHWTPLTNAIFYFRDPDSTDYPQRFYRFRKN